MMASPAARKHTWWKEAVVYQVYPASFQDTNGDGWGDIRGVISRLDYIKDLGVDVIWMCPIFKSPKVDMGYDISDYTDIDPLYGTLEDVELLISEMKTRGMKLIMDMVLNHTSDQHQWFQDSRSSRTHPKRDYYIWKPPRYDSSGTRQPPNNWAMILGGGNRSAWTWDDTTEEYYLSLFTPQQPDLNWDNAELRKALYDAQRFWLDRGVCGFRLDVINFISKDPAFPDAEITGPGKFFSGYKHYCNGPHMHEYLQEMNREVLSKYGAVTVGEMPHVDDPDEILRTVGANAGELSMIFIFDIVDIDGDPKTGNAKYLHPWNANDLRRIINRWQRLMYDRDGWNALFCENHDTPRSLTRYCDDSDEWRVLGAKLLALMMTTLGGTLYVYQGQELGLRNMPREWDLSEYKDVGSITYWDKMKALNPDNEAELTQARKILQRKARDNTRLPMQWTPEKPNAGFCPSEVTPWMRVNDDFADFNAEAQLAFSETPSVREFWKQRLTDRKEWKNVFVYGDFALVGGEDDEKVIAYKRTDGSNTFAIVLNLSGQDVQWNIPEEVQIQDWTVGNYETSVMEHKKTGTLTLKPWEALMGKC